MICLWDSAIGFDMDGSTFDASTYIMYFLVFKGKFNPETSITPLFENASLVVDRTAEKERTNPLFA